MRTPDIIASLVRRFRQPVPTAVKRIDTLNLHHYFDRYFTSIDDGDASMRMERPSRPYTQVSWVYACVRKVATAVESLPFYLTAAGGEGEPIEQGVVAELLARPSDMLDARAMLGLISVWLDLAGEAHWLLEYDGAVPRNVFMPNPQEMQPIIEAGRLVAWKWQHGGRILRLPAEDLVTFRLPNPYDPVRGLAPLDAAAKAIDIDYASLCFNERVLEQGGAIGGVLETEQPLAAEQVERLRNDWQKRYTGARKAAKTPVLHSGLKYEPISWSPEELTLDALRKMTREEVCSALGVPPVMVGILDDATYSNFDQASRTFWQDRVKPVASLIARQLTATLCARYQPGTVVEVDWSVIDELGENLTEKLEQAEKLRLLGYTPNEINDRIGLGMQEVAELNVRLVPSTMQTLENAQRPPPEPMKPNATEKPPAARSGAKMLVVDREVADAVWKRVMGVQARVEGKMRREAEEYYRALRAAMLARVPQGGGRKDVEAAASKASANMVDYIMEATYDVSPDLAARLAPYMRLAAMAGAAQVERELGVSAQELLQRLEPYVRRYIAARQLRITQTVVKGTLRDAVAEAVAESLRDGESLDGIRQRLKDAFKDRTIVDPSRIARTESGMALNNARKEAFYASGVKLIQWLSAADDAVRDGPVYNHKDLHMKVQPLGMEFSSKLRWPHDEQADAGDVINCRCTVVAAEEY